MGGGCIRRRSCLLPQWPLLSPLERHHSRPTVSLHGLIFILLKGIFSGSTSAFLLLVSSTTVFLVTPRSL